jgi:hypothetical protein
MLDIVHSESVGKSILVLYLRMSNFNNVQKGFGSTVYILSLNFSLQLYLDIFVNTSYVDTKKFEPNCASLVEEACSIYYQFNVWVRSSIAKQATDKCNGAPQS